MDDDYPEKPNIKRLGILTILLLFVIAFYSLNILGFFDEPEEPEGIFVKLILFFKQNTLI